MYSSISYSKVSHPQETIDSFLKIKLVCFQKGSKRFVTNILIRRNTTSCVRIVHSKASLGMEEKQSNFLDKGSFTDKVIKNITSSGYKFLVQAPGLYLTHMVKLKKKK
jgi:hypothetical protein